MPNADFAEIQKAKKAGTYKEPAKPKDDFGGVQVDTDAPILAKPQPRKPTEAIDTWLNTDSDPVRPVPAGLGTHGDIRIRSGQSFPREREAAEKGAQSIGSAAPDTMPTGRLARAKNYFDDAVEMLKFPKYIGQAPTGSDGRIRPPHDAVSHLVNTSVVPSLDPNRIGDIMQEPTSFKDKARKIAEPVIAPLSFASDIVNDISTRLSNARRWSVNDPTTNEDDSQYEYTTPNNKTFKGPKGDDLGDLVYFRRYKDGSVLSDEQVKALEPSGLWVLADGTELTEQDITTAKPVDRNTYELSSGQLVDAEIMNGPKTTYLVHPDMDRKFPVDLFDTEPVVDHAEFPDGTPFSQADQSQPAWIKDAPKREVGTGLLDSVGWGIDDPRPPWQDTAGHNLTDPEYDWRNSAINELPAFAGDMGLGSALYMSPASRVVGAGVAAPYLTGYAGDTYMPTGIGFDNLHELGLGTYANEDMTNGQILGGTGMTVADALAETYMGQAIGGIENVVPGLKGSRAGHYMKTRAPGQVVSGFVGEGSEELWSSPFQQMRQEGWENLGREYTVGDDGEKDFDLSTPKFGTMPETAMQDFLAGGAFGATLEGPMALNTAAHNHRYGAPVYIKPNPQRTEEQRQAAEASRWRAIERFYRDKEK